MSSFYNVVYRGDAAITNDSILRCIFIEVGYFCIFMVDENNECLISQHAVVESSSLPMCSAAWSHD